MTTGFGMTPADIINLYTDIAVLLIDEGYDLSEYGLDATVIHLPGHTTGSIGILTNDGDLFCGDLLLNIEKPSPHEGVDDPAEMKASIEKVIKLKINTVHPGHGKPFTMEQYIKNNS